MMTPTCSHCRFALISAPGMDLAVPKTYACRRYPPTTHIVAGPSGQPIVASAYPTMKEDSWCGEYTSVLTLDLPTFTSDEHL